MLIEFFHQRSFEYLIRLLSHCTLSYSGDTLNSIPKKIKVSKFQVPSFMKAQIKGFLKIWIHSTDVPFWEPSKMKIQIQTHLDFARKNPGWSLVVLDGLWGVSDAWVDALIIISLYFLLELKRHLNWSDFSVCPAPSAGCATGPSRAACTWISFSCSQSVSRSIACQPCLQPSLCPPHQKRPPWK